MIFLCASTSRRRNNRISIIQRMLFQISILMTLSISSLSKENTIPDSSNVGDNDKRTKIETLPLSWTENSPSTTSSTIDIQKSIGGAILERKSNEGILSRPNSQATELYYNSANDISQPIPDHEKKQIPSSNTEELYYNAANNAKKESNKVSVAPSFLTQSSVPYRGLRVNTKAQPTTAPTKSKGKTEAAPTVDLFGSAKVTKSSNKHETNKKAFLNYEKPLVIEPYNTILSNGREFPLVGIGAGNIPRQRIPLMINEAMSSVRLVDTSHVQSNESLVARAILHWLKAQPKVSPKDFNPSQHVIHIVTKVWYSHLGYERTSLSVRESLSDLSSILSSSKNIGYQVKVHAIIQYPRCYDEIEWMRCQEEEMELDAHTRSVGPDPNLDPDHAWKGSWKALEEIYQANLLESIGVSNFKLNDMTELLDMCTVKPHIFQGNLYNVIFDTELMELLKKYNIFFQTYNILKDTIGRKSLSPRSFAVLQRMGLKYAVDGMNGGFSGAQVLLSWLIQHGHGVIPGSSQEPNLIENLPQFIIKIPKYTALHDIDVNTSIMSLLKGVDASEYHFSGTDNSKGVVVTFYNAFFRAVKLFAVKNGRQIAASAWVETGKSNRIIASKKDVFVAYDVHGTAIKRFRIVNEDGLEESLIIEL